MGIYAVVPPPQKLSLRGLKNDCDKAGMYRPTACRLIQPKPRIYNWPTLTAARVSWHHGCSFNTDMRISVPSKDWNCFWLRFSIFDRRKLIINLGSWLTVSNNDSALLCFALLWFPTHPVLIQASSWTRGVCLSAGASFSSSRRTKGYNQLNALVHHRAKEKVKQTGTTVHSHTGRQIQETMQNNTHVLHCGKKPVWGSTVDYCAAVLLVLVQFK